MRRATLLLLGVLAGPAAAGDRITLDTAVHQGRRLVETTYAVIGPEVADPAMRFSGNNLACANCHLDGGTRPNGLALTGVSARYPRDGETLADRINGCMTRSMNGRPLPEGGPEMAAILAYLDFLTRDAGSFDDPAELPVAMAAPDAPPDPARGALLYRAECAACHGDDGAGVRNGQPGDALGYLHPPLWGPDSFNAAAGMHRLAVAATFIHDNMPPGSLAAAPTLPPRDAWDIAAFIEAQPRPPAPQE